MVQSMSAIIVPSLDCKSLVLKRNVCVFHMGSFKIYHAILIKWFTFMCGHLLVSCILMYPRSSMLLKYTFKIKLYAYMSYLASSITRSPCYADAKRFHLHNDINAGSWSESGRPTSSSGYERKSYVRRLAQILEEASPRMEQVKMVLLLN